MVRPDEPKTDDRAYIFMNGSVHREGGIASAVTRVSKAIAGLGSTCLVVIDGPVPEHRFAGRVDAMSLSECGAISIVRRVLATIRPGQPVTIMSHDPTTAARAFLIAILLRIWRRAEVRFCIAIYHPREFYPDFENDRMHRINTILARAFGFAVFRFMNSANQRPHEEFWGLAHQPAQLFPLPIDDHAPCWIPRPVMNTLKICSVGRIIMFKAYNFTAPSIVMSLRAQGHEVLWDIFGYGEDAELLKRAIVEHDAGPYVRMRGELPLSDFDDVVSQYDLFIGMGTAALQAGQAGVPTLLAIDRDSLNTYGYLDEVPEGIVGEDVAAIARSSFESRIVRYLFTSTAERTEISVRQIAHLRQFDLGSFLSSVNSVPKVSLLRMIPALLAAVTFLAMNAEGVRRIVGMFRQHRL